MEKSFENLESWTTFDKIRDKSTFCSENPHVPSIKDM